MFRYRLVDQRVQPAIVAIGPDVSAGIGLDELTGNADARSRLANAALQDVANPKLASDLLRGDSLALVSEA